MHFLHSALPYLLEPVVVDAGLPMCWCALSSNHSMIASVLIDILLAMPSDSVTAATYEPERGKERDCML